MHTHEHTITQQRLRNQQIATTQLSTPAELVSWLGAIQGQDYTGAKWSLGLRLPGSTDATIEQAIARKTIVRSWAMRGTLHLIAAADLRWLLALLAPRLIAGSARRYRELELDAPTLMRSNSLLEQALAGGQQRTRTQLLAMLEDYSISTKGQRGVFMLQRASLDGLICQNVALRNTPTFQAIDESLPGALLEHDEALAELARRYFTSRGPATLNDYVAWSGLPVSAARAGLAAVQSQLSQATIADQTYWMPPDTQATNLPAHSLYLLPGFDEYLLGYRDRRAALDPQHAQLIVPGGNGIFYSTIVSDGRVVGTWRRALKQTSVVITTQAFQPLSAAEQQALHTAAERYGRFLELPALLPEFTL